MCITATLNALTQPVIAFLKIKLQFTFFSKAEGNTEWEEEAIQWLIFLACWIFLQIIVKSCENSIFKVMGEKMTLLIRIQLIEEILHK